jgi:hypothetical protein
MAAASITDLSALREELMLAHKEEMDKLKQDMQKIIDNMKEQMNKMGKEDKKEKSLVYIKNMTPFKLENSEDYRKWMDEVQDYCDEVLVGMKDQLIKVKTIQHEIKQIDLPTEWWNKNETLAKFLKKYTGGDANRVVMTISNDNGWEMWRKINAMFEPNLAVKQAQYMAQFTGMVNKKSKSMKETKMLLMEMEEKAKRVEEILGKPIEKGHAASVIAGILDSETLKHIAQTPEIMTKPEEMKRKAMEYILMMSESEEPKKKEFAGSLDEDSKEEPSEEDKDWEKWEEYVQSLYGFGEKCFECGEFGHYARECPHKGKGKGGNKGKGKGKGGVGKGSFGGWPPGKGKGKGKGSDWYGGQGGGKGKGKGKGSGPRDGCFTCGGSHYAKDCPSGNGQGNIRSLGCLKTVTKNRYQDLTADEEEGEDKASGTSGSDAEASGYAEARGGDGKAKGSGKEQEETEVTIEMVVEEVRTMKMMIKEMYVRARKKKTNKKRKASGTSVSDAEASGYAEARREAAKGSGKEKEDGGRDKPQELKIFGTVIPAGVNMMGKAEGEWEQIEMAVDSGATETVVGEDMLQGIKLIEGEACRKGVQYEVASGTLIPNLGEKQFVAVGENGEKRKMTAQVCEVNKALLSVSKMVRAGNRVVFEAEGSYVEDRHSGEVMYLEENGGMYMMKLWVKSGF